MAMNRLLILSWLLLLDVNLVRSQTAATNTNSASPLKVLALAEPRGHHVGFTAAAKPWLKKCGQQNGFEVDFIEDTSPITEAFLGKYQLVLQLDFVPYGW